MQSHIQFAMFQKSLSPRDHQDGCGLQSWYWREPSIGSYINRACSDRLSIPESGFRPHPKFPPRRRLARWNRSQMESDVDLNWCSALRIPQARPAAQKRSRIISTCSLSPRFGLGNCGKVCIDPVSNVGHHLFFADVVEKIVKMAFVEV